MIVVEHLTRRFGRFTAVDDVSFRVEKGEVVGFLGPNGAGKTTTMRMLTGFLPPTTGSVEVAGFDVLRRSLEVRKRIGYLPETVPLYEEHRVEEMLRFQARLHGIGGKAARLRIAAILERVGMVARRRSLIGQLSKGMRQRVGLAVALLPDPEVLILDEPTSGLDPLQRVEVRALVSRLAKEHTVLVSSHILPEIEAVCPRVIVMDGGRIAADGTQEELVAGLGGGAHVRLEAVVGQDFEGAIRLMKTLPGVEEVRYRGKLGIHHCFDVESTEDLREDVGALAMQRGWAVRELSWKRPTLEQVFSRIALGGEAAPAPAPAPVRVPVPVPVPVPGKPEKPKKPVYNLNPFEKGPKVEPPGTGIQFEKSPESEYEKRLKRPKEPPRDLYGRSDGS